MMFNPIERSFSQFRRSRLSRRQEFYLIEFLSRKSFGKLPRLEMQRFHSAAPALLAKQPRFPGCMERRLGAERRAACRASMERRQPSTKAHGPECEVTQRQLPHPRAFNLAHRKQEKTEHGLGRFMLREHVLGNFADNGQSGTQLVVALRLVKRFEQ